MRKLWREIIKLYRSLRGRLVYKILSIRSGKVPEAMEVSIRFPGIRTPIVLRLKTSDLATFKDIFVKGQYDFNLGSPPAVIIDAGANIGLTSISFANRFPQAKIIAIEPEPSNYAVLVKNVAGYANIFPVQAAVWNANEMVNIVDPGLGNWGFQVERGERDTQQNLIECPGMTIDTIMKDHDVDYVDILKVDIEGGEKEVFENAGAWIDKIGLLTVELHDRLKAGCSESLDNATGNFKKRWKHGENVYFSSY